MSQVVGVSQAVQPRKRNLRPLYIAVGLVVIAILTYFASMMIRMNTLPPNLDYSTTRTSEQGLFRGTWVSQLEPLEINKIHTWTIHVETSDGQPLDAAQFTVDGGMPQHGHGLPTQPQVTQNLGNGDYRVEGMKFQMTGWWVVNFHIAADGKSDTLQFNLLLK
ncbi:MAG: Auxin-binding protein [Anaerolineaceae bacterium]|nr:Auxin-binding protein [Anaerolineaceae bacterium]